MRAGRVNRSPSWRVTFGNYLRIARMVRDVMCGYQPLPQMPGRPLLRLALSLGIALWWAILVLCLYGVAGRMTPFLYVDF